MKDDIGSNAGFHYFTYGKQACWFGVVFVPFLRVAIICDDFHAESRQLMESRLNRAGKGEARAAEKDARTHALIPSGPITEAGMRRDRALPTF